jgi:glutamate-1-semialdehyde 2,1-aminomutase
MKRKASEALFRRACLSIAGGVNSPVRAFKAVGGTPVFMASGKGSRLSDADGRDYIDYCLSWGPLILGHAHPEVLSAARKALEAGSSFGAPTGGETLLAEAVRSAFPSIDLLRMTSSGTEAVMSALRLARAFTSRELTVKFSGCYHGHADSLLVAAGSGAASLGRPDSAGVPAPWAASTLVLPYNDRAAAFAAFRRLGREIAAVIVEPIAANMGLVPPEPGFLETLRTLTETHGALLIFDEVVTGFRAALGGAQELYGVRPDMTCLGKIIGHGFPAGAFGGRRDVMENVAPLGPAYQAGTLSGNPVAAAAGLAAIEVLKRDDPYGQLEALGRELAEGLREAAKKAGAGVQVRQLGSMLTVFFTDRPVTDWAQADRCDRKAFARFFHALLEEGVYFPPAQFETAMLSTAHTPEDIRATLRAARKAFRAK